MCPFQFQALLAHLNLPMAYHGIQCRSNFHISLYVVTLAILPDVTVQITVLFIHSLFYDSVSAREHTVSASWWLVSYEFKKLRTTHGERRHLAGESK